MPDPVQLRTDLVATFQQQARLRVQRLADELLPLTSRDGDAHFFAGKVKHGTAPADPDTGALACGHPASPDRPMLRRSTSARWPRCDS